jgi:hypothetical protein
MKLLYRCLECKAEIISKDKDGKKCKECNGHLVPVCYAGIDLGSGPDMTAYPPGMGKGQK